MALLKYQIVPPSTIVEASFSPEPDDDSEVDITIEATPSDDIEFTAPDGVDGAKPKLKKIEFVVPVAPIGATAGKETALTSKPARIQPVSRQPNDWAIVFRPDGTGPGTVIFEATPLRDGVLPSGKSLVFRLLDVVVIDQDGPTKIVVRETLSDGSVGAPELNIRKVPPALRIDSFAAFKSTSTTELKDAEAKLITTAVKQTGTLFLSWATTGARLIFIDGLSPEDRQRFEDKFKKPPGSTRSDNAENSDLRDASFDITPATTTTYTLRAESGNPSAPVTRQLTITVTDQLTAPFLSVGTFTTQPTVAPGDAHVAGKLHAHEIHANSYRGLSSSVKLLSTRVRLNNEKFTQPGDFPTNPGQSPFRIRFQIFAPQAGQVVLGHWCMLVSELKSDSLVTFSTVTQGPGDRFPQNTVCVDLVFPTTVTPNPPGINLPRFSFELDVHALLVISDRAQENIS